MSKKALVLGGTTGLLGQALVASLTKNGWRVKGVGRDDVDYFAGNFSKKLAQAIERESPDCIFNTVAYTQVDLAEENFSEADRLNRELPKALGEILQHSSCRLVHYSTDFVFHGDKKDGYDITDAPDPLSVYGKTKLAGEKALIESGHAAHTIIRTAWLFGPGKKNFVRTILDKGKEFGTLSVVNDQVGSPTYTPDLADHSVALAEISADGFFHVVNEGKATWYELAQSAVAIAKIPCEVTPISSREYPQKAPRPACSILQTKSLTKATGRAPRPWVEALREYIEHDILSLDKK